MMPRVDDFGRCVMTMPHVDLGYLDSIRFQLFFTKMFWLFDSHLYMPVVVFYCYCSSKKACIEEVCLRLSVGV